MTLNAVGALGAAWQLGRLPWLVLVVLAVISNTVPSGAAAQGGVGEGVSPPFVLYLGPAFEQPSPGGAGAAHSGPFALYLGLLSEHGAQSFPFAVDTRSLDPAVVQGPTDLVVTPEPCSDVIRLAWVDNSADETGFEVDSKYSGFGDIFYERIATLGPGTTTHLVQPLALRGLPVTFRVRAVKGLARSAYSNEATTQAGVVTASLTPPAGVALRSVGDGDSLAVFIRPPLGVTSWSGISEVLLEITASPGGISTLSASVNQTQGELRRAFKGQVGAIYSVRAQNRTCGGGSNWTAAPRAVQPVQRPIVFLHGIWNRGEVWEPWMSWFDQDALYRRYVVEFTCGGDTWWNWAAELDDWLGEKFEIGVFQDDENIDIVAWSQGGLAARRYIEAKGDAGRVRSLFMIGTPNHGGRFSTLASTLRKVKAWAPGTCDAEGRGEGASALITNSELMRRLNFGEQWEAVTDGICQDAPVEGRIARRQRTRYFTVAGTGDQAWFHEAGLVCRVVEARTAGECAGDGVVPWKSVRLRALAEDPATCRQWLDLEIPGESNRYVHAKALRLPCSGSSPTIDYLGSEQLAHHVAAVLKNDPGTGFGLMCSSAPEPTADKTTSSEVNDPPVLIASHDDSLAVQQVRMHSVWVDSCGGLTILVSSQLRPLTLELITPGSTTLSPADTLAFDWLSYESDDSLAYSAFGIESPTPGLWTLRVSGNSGPDAEYYTESWVSQGSPYLFIAGLSRSEVRAGDTLLVTASLHEGGSPVSAHVAATVEGPNGSGPALTLNDAGVEGDEVASDGLYTARLIPASVDGGHRVLVTASAEAGSSPGAVRSAQLLLGVAHRPEIGLRSNAIAWAPEITAIGRLTELRFWVYNTGSVHADIVRVTFFDSTTRDSLASQVVSVPAGESTFVAALFTPAASGIHAIEVDARLISSVESSVEDNRVVANVPVAGFTPVVGAEEQMVSLPLQFELAPPRPNPFRGVVAFDFALPQTAHVLMEVYDVQGRRVRVVQDGLLPAGRYSRSWDGASDSRSPSASGVYFVRMTAPGINLRRKAVLLR